MGFGGRVVLEEVEEEQEDGHRWQSPKEWVLEEVEEEQEDEMRWRAMVQRPFQGACPGRLKL